MKRIYIVEDENNLGTIIQKYLDKEGYTTTLFNNGEEALKHIEDLPELWLLDIMLPDIDGYQIIEKIKAHNPKTPVIFMSARNEELDRVVGLEKGSEDYISKPFLPKELVIRVNRVFNTTYKKTTSENLQINEYTIVKKERIIKYNNEEIKLTNNEFDLLLYLLKHKNVVINREQILSKVWGYSYIGSDRVVDDTIRRMRKKLPLLPLETIYGIGYKLVVK